MDATRKLTTVHQLEEIPVLPSEAAEQTFWATHELSDTLWDQAEPLEPGELPPPRAPTTPVIIRIEAATLNRIKALARRRHKGYRRLLEEFVTAHLAEEERQTG